MTILFDDDLALEYSSNSKLQWSLALELIEKNPFTGTEDVLDVGCGDGKITAHIAKMLPQGSIVGCDDSHAMIQLSSSRFHSKDYPNLRFMQKNATNLGFHATFDRVVSFSCLHWVENQQQALCQIYESLKPGGKALLTAVPKSVKDDLQIVALNVATSAKWKEYFHPLIHLHTFYTKQEYLLMLGRAGFTIESVEEKITPVHFDTRQAFENWWVPVFTLTRYVDEKKKAELLDDFFAELTRHGCVTASGKVHYTLCKIELILSK
jgi:ubiquinone/menaquinone biosynthesis C-methylase UbiE